MARKRAHSEALTGSRTPSGSATPSPRLTSLTAADGERSGATVLLKDAQQQLSRVAGYDPRFAALAERLSSAFYEAEEMGVELRDLAEGESFDPEQNERILSRLDTYKRLEKRYGMEADELADYAERLRDEMNAFASMDDRLRRAEADFKARLTDYRAAAGELTASRQALAKRFEGMMESQLSELGQWAARGSPARF